MRCKHCDHSLWNQPVPPEGVGRVCSECGAPYAAADFDYGRGKVRFCCPGCDTGYYGTSERGHLEPAEFNCIGCGAHLTMDRCVIRAHDMEREHEAMQQRDLPWLAEGSLGWIRRWWSTARLSLSNATRLGPMLTRPPSVLKAAAFLGVNATIAVVLGGAAPWGFGLLVSPGARMAPIDGTLLLIAVGATLATIVTLVVYAAVPALLCCMLTRGGKPLGFGRSYEIAAYTSGALLISAIPCCGAILGGIWWMVQLIQGYAGAFENESGLKRAAAGLLAFVGFISGIVGFVFVVTEV